MKTTMRVLFVIPGVERGNSMIFARRQAESLENVGVETRLFYLRSRTSPLRLAREFIRFRREIARSNPQVIHAHFGTVTALFAALARRGRPLVITFRGGDLNPLPGFRQFVARVFSQLAALEASAIVCVSRRLRERLWWRRSSVTVLPTGVDPKVFFPTSRRAARIELGWSEQERVVLFNAGHDPKLKRLDLAESAVALASERVRRIRLEILDGTVPPERVPVLMNAADCLLLASDMEGSPTMVQEALATNLPIVSVPVGDVLERLPDVQKACLAGRDPKALGDAIAAMVEPPARSDGRKKVREFSADRIARELKIIYERAALA